MSELLLKFSNQNTYKVKIYDSLNILAHAQILNIDIGSQCGGYGVCGGDRVKIKPSDQHYFSPPTSIEKKHLSNDELKSGIRLACQCYPNASGYSDANITIDVIMSMA